MSDGEVAAFYTGHHEVTLDKDFTGGYFKAGAYTQANCGNSSPCSSGNYGEVIVYDVSVTHTEAAGSANGGPTQHRPTRRTRHR